MVTPTQERIMKIEGITTNYQNTCLKVNPPPPQPVTTNNLPNVNLAQILTLLQTSFLTVNSAAQTVNMPDHGTHAPVDSTGVSGNNQLDDDKLLRDITQ